MLIVRDLPLALSAILIGKVMNIPVVFDMAEDYPAMIRDIWSSSEFKGINFLLRNPYLTEIVERLSLNYSSHILVVAQESKHRLVSKNQLHPKKITVVGNTPPISTMKPKDYRDDNKKRLVYVGGIQMGRGIQYVLDAMPLLLNKFNNIEFVVIGDGYAKKDLMKLAVKNRVEDYVAWLGFIENSKIYDYLARSDIGIIPHSVTDHTNTTIPNKLFDYMKSGLPVIASNAAPMERIIAEANCGVTFESNNARDLAARVIELLSRDDLKKIGRILMTMNF